MPSTTEFKSPLLNPSPILDPVGSLMELEANIIGMVEQRWLHPWKRARLPFVQKYLLNHAFLEGQQYIRHDGRSLVALPRRYKNQVRLVDNQLKPIYRTAMSLLLRNSPQHDLMSFTGDHVDDATTQVGKKLIKALLYATHQKRTDALLFDSLLKGGSGFKRVIWNDTGGPTNEVPVTEDGSEVFLDLEDRKSRSREEVAEILTRMLETDPEFEPASRFVPITEPEYAGEVDVQVKTCLEVVGDHVIPFLEDSPMAFVESARSLDFIKEAFPEKGKFVKPETNTVILFDSGGGAMTLPGIDIPRITGQTSERQQGQPDLAVVRELMIKPMEKNPLTGNPAPYGVHLVWAGNIALTDLDNPLPYAFTPETADHDVDFDLIKYDWLPAQGFNAPNLFSDLLPLQRAWNRRNSQVAESINAFVHPKLQVAMGSKIRKSSITDIAGEVVEYAGVPASYLEPPGLAPHVFRNMDMLKASINDVAMTHEILREGRPPPQVRTAAGLRLLQEQDFNALGVTIAMYEEQDSVFGQKLLDRAKQFYETGRILRYVGERNRLETEEFQRAPFFTNRWAVFVHKGSAFPESRAAKVAEAHEMLQFAPWVFTDDQGRPSKKRYAQLVGRAELEEFLEDVDESRQAAKRENSILDSGEFIEPFQFEDHEVHREVHMRLVRSPDFREKPEQIQQNFLQHLAFHEQALNEMMQQQAQSSAMIQSTAMQAQQAVLSQDAAAAAASAARGAVDQIIAQGGNNGAEQQGQQQGQGQPNAAAIIAALTGQGQQR